jgi:lysozyme
MDALPLAAVLVRGFEQFRAWPYPDPASPLAKATHGLAWGWQSAREIMNKLRPEIRSLSGAPWTVGYGQTGKFIGPDSSMWTLAVGEAHLESTLEFYQAGVRRLCKVSLTKWQEAALISFAYNEGLDEDHDGKAEGLGDSTLLRLVNAGRFADASRQFAGWNKAHGQILAGLTKRRELERQMFLGIHPALRASA